MKTTSPYEGDINQPERTPRTQRSFKRVTSYRLGTGKYRSVYEYRGYRFYTEEQDGCIKANAYSLDLDALGSNVYQAKHTMADKIDLNLALYCIDDLGALSEKIRALSHRPGEAMMYIRYSLKTGDLVEIKKYGHPSFVEKYKYTEFRWDDDNSARPVVVVARNDIASSVLGLPEFYVEDIEYIMEVM